MGCKAYFRLYEELNDYLPAQRKKVTFALPLKGTTSLRNAISSLGVPHAEVDLVLVNGKSVSFDAVIGNGDRVSIYPIFESLDISDVTRLREKSLYAMQKEKNA